MRLKLAFYGDDFTGSTDAMEFLTKAGAKTVLFLDEPSEEDLKKFSDLDAIGIAGMTRAMVPDEMRATLQSAFTSLKSMNPRHVHYKVCSTFDSSPEIGNIGTAIEVGEEVFGNEFTPVLVAAPNLGRYSAFGNLYARMGIGSAGKIYRLDRHPSMSKHPITPADESDLRLHLSKQIERKIGLVDILDVENGTEQILEKLNDLRSDGCKVVFFDAMYETQMKSIGEALEMPSTDTQFSVGSSGIEKALGDHWGEEGKLRRREEWEDIKEEEAILVLSGSCSPVTQLQIETAIQNGYHAVPIGVDGLKDIEPFIDSIKTEIIDSIRKGKSVILHTCKGPDDPRLNESLDYFQSLGLDQNEMRKETAKQFGSVLGRTANRILQEVDVNRVVIAGGDTSSYVARELGIQAVEMIAPIYAGAPLCRAFAPGFPLDGKEVNLKGGQVGDANYFENLRKGKLTI